MRRLPHLLLASILFQAVPAAADIDLTGHWRAGFLADPVIATVVQTGTAISLDWTDDVPGVGVTAFDFDGTFDQLYVTATQGTDWNLQATAEGGGATLRMSIQRTSNGYVFPRTFVRCECYDGNDVDGDGCSAACLIEECWSCTAEPSACSPLADTTPCDDLIDCTTGETCTAGTCGNGTELPDCINMDGLWRIHFDVPDFDYHSVGEHWISQRYGNVTVYAEGNEVGGSALEGGTLFTSTGALHLTRPSNSILCSQGSVVDGFVASSELFWSGAGLAYTSTPHTCLGFDVYERGYRCDPEAGCDLTDCTGQPDGIACSDSDPCTTRETCQGGTCTGEPTCPLCSVCDSSGACIVEPRSDCRASTSPSSSGFQSSDSTDNGRDSMRWSWKRGAETSMEDFGSPGLSTDLALCAFHASGDDYVLSYKEALLATTYCADPPCWTDQGTRWIYKAGKSGDAGISSVQLRSGADGKASIALRGKGALLGSETGMLATPATLPLITQLQMSNGACFQLEILPAGVKSNADGKFKASGATD